MGERHSLKTSNVRSTVDNRIGVYKLYNSHSGPVRFVGMSSQLADRLAEHTDDYEYFEFDYHDNRTAAYEREVNLFHHHGGTDDLDNVRHPSRPHEGVSCPVCGIHG